MRCKIAPNLGYMVISAMGRDLEISSFYRQKINYKHVLILFTMF